MSSPNTTAPATLTSMDSYFSATLSFMGVIGPLTFGIVTVIGGIGGRLLASTVTSSMLVISVSGPTPNSVTIPLTNTLSPRTGVMAAPKMKIPAYSTAPRCCK